MRERRGRASDLSGRAEEQAGKMRRRRLIGGEEWPIWTRVLSWKSPVSGVFALLGRDRTTWRESKRKRHAGMDGCACG